MKRKLALAFVAAVVALAATGLLVLRTRWAGERLCQLAVVRVRQATGLRVSLSECRVEPFKLEVSARDVRLGPDDAPVFAADAVRARLAPVQAPSRAIELSELELTRPRIAAKLPAAQQGGGGACPSPALQRFQVRRLQITEGAVDLTSAQGGRLVIRRVDVRAAPPLPRRGIARLAPAGVRRTGLDVTLAGTHVEAGGRRVELDEVHVAADLALDLSRLDLHLLSAELPGASLLAAGTVEQLCHPKLDLASSLRGRIPALLALLGRTPRSDGRLEADLTIRGAAAWPELAGEVRLAGASIDGWRPGDATAQLRFDGTSLRVERLEVPAAGGRVTASGTLRFEGFAGGGAQKKKEVVLQAEAKLETVELGELLARLNLPGAWVSGRITGTARAAGPVWPLQLEGAVALEVGDFRALPQGWDRVPQRPPILHLPRSRLDADVRVDRGGVTIDEGRLRAGPGTLLTHGALYFSAERGFELAVQGGADLSQLGHVGPVQIGGFADLEGGVVRAAPYGNPHVEAKARVRGLEFLDLRLGDASAAFAYDEFVLRATGVEGRRGATRYQAEASVDLGASQVEVTDARFAIEGRLRDAFEAVMVRFPSAVGARDALDGAVALRGAASGPAAALDATFEGQLGKGTLLGRGYDAGRFAGRVERGERVAFEEVELRRGSGAARARGRIGFAAPFPWDLEGSFARVGVADLGLPGEGWAGEVRGTATLRGSYGQPSLEFAVHGDDVVARGEASLGAVELAGRLVGDRLSLEASAAGARLAATARMAGDMPFDARADLDGDDLMRLRPGGPPSGFRVRARGAATASGKLADLEAAHAELRLQQLRGEFGEARVENAEPVVLVLERRRIAIRSFALRGVNTQLDLAGGGDVSGALAVDARGSLDLRLLAGLLPAVTDPRGQLLLEAQVSGTLRQPSLIGTGRLREASFAVRDLPVAFTGLGGELAFSQDRMLFDGLQGLVNGARVLLAGEVELERFFPARVRVGATFEAVPVRIPEWLPSVVSGRLQAAGTWAEMLLSGKLHVVRALYADPVDLEKRLVEVQGKKPAPRPFDRAGEWLSLDIGLVVDGDARIENDLVRGSLSGDLTLTGTLASVGLVGTLTMRDGGRGTFRGNEFTLTHAVVDFTDRRKVRMSLDVHGESQVRDYQVFMHLFGPYEAPTLRLTSQPALTQEDIVTLLSLGYTSRDAAGGMSGVATAAAAQALFSASGLDDQLRRFVPRGRLLRDFSFRITSAYSEASGQVEPRAEFESKALDERLRLRYQAPMAGARGQRAQAEMRLFSHTSIQYQWDNENPDLTGGDHGVDLKLRWDWND